MELSIPHFSVKKLTGSRLLATIYLLAFCINFVPIDGMGVSYFKVALMVLAPLLFFIKVPYVSKGVLWGAAYWGCCLCCAYFYSGLLRFSSLGYLGLFILAYILYYNLIYSGAFTVREFILLLKCLIIAFGVTLILQQVCILIGLRNMPLVNLTNQPFLSLTKLPSLTIEPSHTARVLTAAMLVYMQCTAIYNDVKRTSFSRLFDKENRWVTILFLYTMLTMGSGTAFIGLGILSLYFITKENAFYVAPFLAIVLFIGAQLELKEVRRITALSEAVMEGKEGLELNNVEGSGATRIIPILNTLRYTDLDDPATWLGHGSKEVDPREWANMSRKMKIVDQYGLLSLIVSIFFVYGCAIRRFWSIETLIFIVLMGFSLLNIYYIWGILMMFTTVRFFEDAREKGLMAVEEDMENDEE